MEDCNGECQTCKCDDEHVLEDHYDENGEWCCDIEEGKLHDMCWYRKPTFKENHPILNKIINIFRCDQ